MVANLGVPRMDMLVTSSLPMDEAPEPIPTDDGGWVLPAAIALLVVAVVVATIAVAVRRRRR